MRSEISARLKELKEEYKKGQERLMALEQETTNLSKTMLRISGAIQVLEELIGESAAVNSNEVTADLERAKNAEK
jgi:predicted nuclease with TOPRIM domain